MERSRSNRRWDHDIFVFHRSDECIDPLDLSALSGTAFFSPALGDEGLHLDDLGRGVVLIWFGSRGLSLLRGCALAALRGLARLTRCPGTAWDQRHAGFGLADNQLSLATVSPRSCDRC